MPSNTESAGGVVRNMRGEIALVLHDDTFWGFPKGHVEEGEVLEATARREIKEEVGLTDLTLVRPLGSYQRYKIGHEAKPIAERELKTIHLFLFDTTQHDFQLTDPRHKEARWLSAEKVAKLLSNEKDRGFFESVKDTLKWRH